MKLTYKQEKELIKKLPELHSLVDTEFKQGILLAGASINSIHLADMRDYFAFQTIKCENKEEAKKLIDKYLNFMQYYEDRHDVDFLCYFYSGMFFTLIQFLSLKFEITQIPGELISYEEFEKSFIKTIKALGV